MPALPENQIPIGEGLHPNGKPGAMFYIDKRRLDIYESDGPEWKYESFRFIPEAIQETDAIFEGLQRHDQRESLCYSVRLTRDPDDESSDVPPRFGFVFLVFVQTGVGGFAVMDVDWREEHGDDPGHPLNWENDFARRTWSRI